MFKVRRRNSEEIVTVLDTYLDDILAVTFFLIWENGDWRWRPASNFVPPNYREE